MQIKSIQYLTRTILFSLLCLFAPKAHGTTTELAIEAEQPHPKPVRIVGKVTDVQGQPLPGATLQSPNGKTLAVTNADGMFSFDVPSGTATVRAKVLYLGMEPKTLVWSAPFEAVSVVLNEQINTLGEVVTTGYNRLLKRRTAGSFAEIGKEKIENQVPTSIDKILQGQIAGLNVSVTNGQPGQTAQVRIRGVNTISGSAEPLWVVDGVIVQDNLPAVAGTGKMAAGDFSDIFRNGIGDINPNDIEQVTVLKDAVAAAIYGSRSAGGVIVITTKRGKEGKPRINYGNQFTLGIHPQRQENRMSAAQKIDWEQQLWDEFSAPAFNAQSGWYPVVGLVGMVRANKVGKNGTLWNQPGFEVMTEDEKNQYLDNMKQRGVNWYDEIFRNAFSQSHNLSVAGGTRKMDYYTSAGYTNDRGLVKQTDYNRYTFNMKINADLSSRFKISFKTSAAYQVSNGYVSSVDPFKYAYFANPYETPYNADGSYRSDLTYFLLNAINAGNATPPAIPANGFNILREMNETNSTNTKASVQVQGAFDWYIVNRLKLSALGAYSINEVRSMDEMARTTYAAFNNRLPWDLHNNQWMDYGILRQSFNRGQQYLGRIMLNYTADFGSQHHLSAIAGSEIRSAHNERALMMQYGYDAETKITGMPEPPAEASMSAAEWVQLVNDLSSTQWDDNKYASFFGTIDYNYRNTYTVNAALRTDGSNNFGSKEQFNPTWSVGVAWNIDNEKFWKPLQNVVNRFTLRAAYGYTGNVVQGVLKTLVIETGRKKWHDHATGTVKTAPNEHLRWEQTRDRKVGVELGFLNDRLNVVAEMYEKLGTDLITRVGTVSTTGFTTQSYNTSTLRNSGFELTLSGTPVKTSQFALSASINMAWNRNELVKYVAPFFGISDGKYEGYPVDAIFNGIPTGIDPQTGMYTFKTVAQVTGNTAIEPNSVANYQFYLGTRNAPYNGGGNLEMRYKNLSLSIYAAYSLGGKTMDNIVTPVNAYQVGYNRNNEPQTDFSDLYTNHLNVERDRTNRWTTQTPAGVKYPRIVDAFGQALGLDADTPNGSNIVNGIYLRNVSYVRLRNVALTYKLPASTLKAWGVNNLSVSCSAQNLFTFTNYPGIDPEQPGLTYPITRSFSLGIQLGF